MWVLYENRVANPAALIANVLHSLREKVREERVEGYAVTRTLSLSMIAHMEPFEDRPNGAT